MKDNTNKLFGGLGPEKAGELGGNAAHKCRGRECDEKNSHAKDAAHHDKSKSATTHKTGVEHAQASKAKTAHPSEKAGHNTTTNHKD